MKPRIRRKPIIKKFCIKCNTDNPGDNKWRRGMCHKCYNKYFLNPRWAPINDPMRINPGGKGHIRLDHNPRTGVCAWCGKKKGDEYINTRGKTAIIKFTNIHHIAYHDDPLKDTVELCNSCHTKESMRLRKLNNQDNRDPKTGRFIQTPGPDGDVSVPTAAC